LVFRPCAVPEVTSMRGDLTMRNKTRLIIAVPAVVLGLGAGYYWYYVRPAVEADKVFREGLRLYEEAKSEHGGRTKSSMQPAVNTMIRAAAV